MAIAITGEAASHRAYQILHFAFVVEPIVAGLDKYFHILCNWDKYLWPGISRIVPAHQFMMVVGVIEVIAGLIVLFKPKVGSWIVMAWLWAIIINLLLIPGYYDIAARDFGLSLGAMALGFLALDHEDHGIDRHRRREA